MIVILYVVLGVLSAFTACVIGKVHGLTDETLVIMYPIIAGIFWPIAIPLTMAAYLILAMDGLSSKVAERFKK